MLPVLAIVACLIVALFAVYRLTRKGSVPADKAADKADELDAIKLKIEGDELLENADKGRENLREQTEQTKAELADLDDQIDVVADFLG